MASLSTFPRSAEGFVSSLAFEVLLKSHICFHKILWLVHLPQTNRLTTDGDTAFRAVLFWLLGQHQGSVDLLSHRLAKKKILLTGKTDLSSSKPKHTAREHSVILDAIQISLYWHFSSDSVCFLLLVFLILCPFISLHFFIRIKFCILAANRNMGCQNQLHMHFS